MLSQRVKFSSFLWPCSILLCKCPIVVLSTHLLIDMGCCHTLTIVNNSAMNIGVLMSFQISVLGPFRCISRCEMQGRCGMAGSKGRAIFSISILLSTVAAPIYIPTNSAKEFPFLHILESTSLLVY